MKKPQTAPSTSKSTLITIARVFLWLEIIGLVVWLFSIIPVFIVDKVWRASHILIGFHSILSATLYLIIVTHTTKFTLVRAFPLFIAISFIIVIGTDTIHLFGVVSEYDDFYVHATENNRSRSIYILELVLATYFSFMTATVVTWTVIYALYLGILDDIYDYFKK